MVYKQLLLLILGLAFLMVGAEFLIRGATSIARAFNIPALVVGLTVVAFGTSAPELFVSVDAALHGTADVAVGNVVGSNICNVLLIIGIAALMVSVRAPRAVRVREMPIMLGSLAALWLFSRDGILSRLDGIILFTGIITYLLFTYYLIKRGPNPDGLEAIEEEVLESTGDFSLPLSIACILGGLLGMVFGAEWIVNSAIIIAQHFHIPELVIAVTLVALGTSLPELATTILAARKGQADLAVGNAIGSNIFNVMCVLGTTATIQPISVSRAALSYDIPFMFISCSLAWILVRFRSRLDLIEGLLFLSGYGLYIYFNFV